MKAEHRSSWRYKVEVKSGKSVWTFTDVISVNVTRDNCLQISVSEGYNKYYVFPIANISYWKVEDGRWPKDDTDPRKLGY